MGVGELDDVIPNEATHQLRTWLRRHTTLAEHSYPALGHEISAEEIAHAVRFVEKLTAPA